MSEWPRGDGPGDRIEQLYDRFATDMFRYALMILADPSGAADAVQQVFVSLLRSVGPTFRSGDTSVTVGPTFRSGGGPLRSGEERYLKRAVRNECYSALRRRRRDIVQAVDSQLLEAVAGQADRPDERLLLESAIRTLPPEQREVVHLKIFEGFTFQEIADLAEESINTVASRYRYALEKLREKLRP